MLANLLLYVLKVALGRCKDVYQREIVTGVPDGYDSVRAVAASYPDPQYDVTLPTGFTSSQHISASCLYYDECVCESV